LGKWLAITAKKTRASTLENYLSALRSVHIDRRMDIAVFASLWLKRILAGIKRYETEAPTKKTMPISATNLEKVVQFSYGPLRSQELRKNLNLTAAAKIAFAGFLQMGEFTINPNENTPQILQTKLVHRDITFANDKSHIILRLRRSKADINHQGIEIVLARTSTRICPVEAIYTLFEHDPQPADSPLFNINGNPLRRDIMIGFLKQRLEAVGINNIGYAGHSFRRGAVQYASV
jgi:hypothetical protein